MSSLLTRPDFIACPDAGRIKGVVYDGQGDIVTNAHVVGKATTAEVGTAEGGSSPGQMMQAKVVGTFAADDLAVVLTAVLATAKPGMKVAVQYSRDGGTAETTVTLGNLES